MAKGISGWLKDIKPKKKRPGIHSKTKSSKVKSSKYYKKAYRGQGR